MTYNWDTLSVGTSGKALKGCGLNYSRDPITIEILKKTFRIAQMRC
jgi:hypothetical protein